MMVRPKILSLLMSWACSRFTFINPSSFQKSACKICLFTNTSSSFPSPSPSPSSSSSTFLSFSPSLTMSKWACKACTFLNHYDNTSCEICANTSSASLLSAFLDDDAELKAIESSSIGDVFFPLKACNNSNKNKRKMDDEAYQPDTSTALSCSKSRKCEIESAVLHEVSREPTTLKILSYNIWFREDLEMHARMRALSDLIQLHSPDIMCFQEVTPNLYELLQQHSWWKLYRCSVTYDMSFTRPYFCMQLSKLSVKSYTCKPFANSAMGRELCVAEIDVQNDGTLVVATSHLESPCPAPPTWNQMFSKERVEQANEAIKALEKNPNVIFCGDMNWDDKLDGQFPIPDDWVDAWKQLRPLENGWTYDTKSNKMLTGNRTLQKRLDRFVCKLQDFRISQIEMIGMDEIPGLSYCKEKKVKKEVKNLILPVLPSDHYGLLLTICPK